MAILTDAIRSDGTLVLTPDQRLLIKLALEAYAKDKAAWAAHHRGTARAIGVYSAEPERDRVRMDGVLSAARRDDANALEAMDLAALIDGARIVRVTLAEAQLAGGVA